ncbi:MAG: hypothetical protein COA42_21610 [Alteromonadaceae bacterium]|nr:MAG: hypothetical protein COA42_21610 [Alteromonadaceae bacterium]
MAKGFLQRLSYRLIRGSLSAVFVLGVVIAAVQVYVDYHNQNQNIDHEVEQILSTTHAAALRAVRMQDTGLAGDLVSSLQKYDYFYAAAIVNENGEPLATFRHEIKKSSTSWLTEHLRGTADNYEQDLIADNNQRLGRLVIGLDNDIALSSLYKRASTIVVTSILGNAFIVMMLAYIYHHFLTRPLYRIAWNFSHIDYNQKIGRRLEHLKGHTNDELGFIVDSANKLMKSLELREQELEQNESQLIMILNSSPNQLFAINEDGNIVFLNTATANFFGKHVDELVGKDYYALHKSINPREAKTVYNQIVSARNTLQAALLDKQVINSAENIEYYFHMSFIPYNLGDQRCVLVIASDVTARVQAEERVEKLAYYDTLTNLPNRNRIMECLVRDIEESRKGDTYGAVLFIDFDDFKRINDTLGHSAGDKLLLALANRMQLQIQKNETLARLSGDEFILSIPNISSDISLARQHAEGIAQKLLDRVRTPIAVVSQEFSVSASIGIALYSRETKDIDMLLSAADTAMYEAKKLGRDRYAVFEQRMSEEANLLVALELDMNKAVSEDQFDFFLQPLLHSRTRKLMGAEALLRWRHPERGIIPPAEFIGFLESSPLICQVGEMTLNKVCEFIHNHEHLGITNSHFRIAINISANELYQDHFVEMVTETLRKHKLRGRNIEFEITEGAALQRLDDAVSKMLQLRAYGITFSLDDFGTGYSSLSYLKELPVDKVKIDKSFINDITIDEQSADLVASILAIAKTLNLRAVAEGVETEAQAEWLRRHGEVLFQGYLFDKPLEKSAFAAKYF